MTIEMVDILKNAKYCEQVLVFDRAFHYGDGCFTTARIQNGQLELWQRHQQRLVLACEKLQLKFDWQSVEDSLHLLAKQHKNLNGTLKILVSRGEGQRGYSLPHHAADVWVFYYPHEIEDFKYDSCSIGILPQRIGLQMPNLVGLKSLNRLEQIVLKSEADQRGWKEGLVIDLNDQIVEGISSNCFLLVDKQWISPELRYNGVHGVMRAEILARMEQAQIAYTLRAIHMHELAHVQSIFFCNALSPMKIVTQLDQYALDAQACIELFYQLQLNQMHTYVKN